MKANFVTHVNRDKAGGNTYIDNPDYPRQLLQSDEAGTCIFNVCNYNLLRDAGQAGSLVGLGLGASACKAD